MPESRTFVNFPRSPEDAPISLAELGASGDLRPYPDTEWNADGKRFYTLLRDRDRDLACPDTSSEGADGTLYVTDSRIPAMSWFDPQNSAALPTRLHAIRGR